jgi:hypothetical protein
VQGFIAPALTLWRSGFISQNHLGAGRNDMDFTSIFNGEALTIEQFTEKTKGMKLADLATGEYVSKGKYDADIKKERDGLKEARETITTLEANKGDTEALQAELDKYKRAEEERQKAEQEAAARSEMMDRFNRAKGENVFSSEFAESGALDAFRKAISDPANKGKGDNEIFESLTKDKDGVFKSKNPPANMGGIGGADNGNGAEPAKTTMFF